MNVQVGEYDLVVAMGTNLLEKWESRAFKRDILLSMALAQCGLATDTFAVKQVLPADRCMLAVFPHMPCSTCSSQAICPQHTVQCIDTSVTVCTYKVTPLLLWQGGCLDITL